MSEGGAERGRECLEHRCCPSFCLRHVFLLFFGLYTVTGRCCLFGRGFLVYITRSMTVMIPLFMLFFQLPILGFFLLSKSDRISIQYFHICFVSDSTGRRVHELSGLVKLAVHTYTAS